MAMDLPSKQQRTTFDSHSLDRISNLPKEVSDEILRRMPIIDAIMTSMLSTAWRYKWMSMPDLVFEFDTRSTIEGGTRSANFVNNVLLLHNGDISMFVIDNFLDNGVSDIDRWVLVLSRTTLNHFSLVFKRPNPYQLPSCLFNCEHLGTLKLESCTLRLPCQYKGLNYLTVLELCKVSLTSETIENLVNKSPLLQSVRVWNCDTLTCLTLHAPNLTKFAFKGRCEKINFQHTSKLVYVTIYTWLLLPRFHTTCRLDDILPTVASISYISLLYPFMEFSPADSSPKRLQTTYNCLKIVDLHINYEDSKQLYAVLCLFRSSPYIEKMFLKAKWHRQTLLLYQEDFWEGRVCKERDIFNHLKTVSLSGFKGAQHVLYLVQFILLNAVVLETFTINWVDSVQKDQTLLPMFEKMMQFKRASSEAKVVFSGLT